MYTSLVFVALGSLVAGSVSQDGVVWQKDYAQARKAAQTEKKPLAVIFGSGPMGFDKVCRDGQISPALRKALADNYVCLYADVSTPAGKKMAETFGINQSCGIVLSDRTGDLMAFYHDGDLTDADLARWVNRFADPNVVVNSTKTNTSSQVSFYPPEANGALGASGAYNYIPAGYGYGYAPGYYQAGGMYYGGGGYGGYGGCGGGYGGCGGGYGGCGFGGCGYGGCGGGYGGCGFGGGRGGHCGGSGCRGGRCR
jgi:hypothetical protein